MNITVVDDYEAVSSAAAEWFAARLREKPDSAAVLAMGNTPMGMYARIADMVGRRELDLSRMKAFQLDGYVGVDPDDPRSLEGWLRRSVVTPWGLRPDQVVRLPEDGRDPEGACRDYDAAVRAAGGFDIVVLGLGPNGHLGYNEPPSPADAPTRVVTLRPESAASAAAYFGDAPIPQRGMTAGMDVLLAAKHILLIVSGASKRDILHSTICGPVTPDVPSSFLQGMASVTIIADREAAQNVGGA